MQNVGMFFTSGSTILSFGRVLAFYYGLDFGQKKLKEIRELKRLKFQREQLLRTGLIPGFDLEFQQRLEKKMLPKTAKTPPPLEGLLALSNTGEGYKVLERQLLEAKVAIEKGTAVESATVDPHWRPPHLLEGSHSKLHERQHQRDAVYERLMSGNKAPSSEHDSHAHA
eukprot:TRINITY_DN1454_c0_g1_i1.p1 TRINITY_DN1454_c0_g1~~TRINITY_DN1454_c0_g1_i1.p1  ORF type:complete len:169 (+),score=32.15 TRINITY_DN1454_c0_g1_i1:45-551(+)